MSLGYVIDNFIDGLLVNGQQQGVHVMLVEDILMGMVRLIEGINAVNR